MDLFILLHYMSNAGTFSFNIRRTILDNENIREIISPIEILIL